MVHAEAKPLKVLIVEDEASFLEALRVGLSREGFAIDIARDGREALERFAASEPDIILLDVMLPRISGIDVCREIRSTSDVPIIMVTAKGEEIDAVVGLEVGADDYVTKPYRFRELVARMRSVLRRAEMLKGSMPDEHRAEDGARQPIVAGEVHIDPDRHEVRIRGDRVDLPLKEFDLLVALASNAGRVLTRDQLIDQVWGEDYVGDTKTLDVHIKRLRIADVVLAPNLVDELISSQHTTCVRGERDEQIKFLEGQVDSISANANFVAVGIDVNLPRNNGLARTVFGTVFVGHRSFEHLGSSKHGPHTSDELAEPIRLRHVVVCADLEPDDRVDLFALGSHHDDGHIARGPDLAAHIDAGNPREHHVEKDDVRLRRSEAFECLAPIASNIDCEPFAAQTDTQGFEKRGLVFDDQDFEGLGLGVHHVSLPRWLAIDRRGRSYLLPMAPRS